MTIINDYNYTFFTGYTANLLKNHNTSELLLRIFRAAKLDFEHVEVKTINIDENLTQFLSSELKELVRRNLPEQVKVFTKHQVYDLNGQVAGEIDFDIKEESAGSQKFFAIAGPIFNSLLNGHPIIIDEMDAKLHFELVRLLVRLFCSDRHNPHGGQLVYSNQMLDLMDRQLLRRDQLLIVSKTRTGSELSSFHQRGARSDTSFKNDYLSGAFGGIPDVEFNQLDLF